jgi:hypothetical protein
MRHRLGFVRFAAPGVAALRVAALGVSMAGAFPGPAHALLIVPSFDSTLTSQANAAALEAAINNAVTTIDGLYSNPGTVKILFEYNGGVLGQSQNGESFVPYSQYVSQLAFDSATHPSNTVLASAVANIGKGNIGDYVLGTTAFLRVGMGFTGAGTTPCYNAAGSFVSGCNSIYDGIITIGNVSTSPAGVGQNSQALAVVEHEVNEVLGGGGPGTTIGQNLSGMVSGVALGPMDLYRYQSSGSTCAGVDSTPSYTTSSAVVACYSYDGGVTALVQMNQAGGGSDYGDFATTSPNTPYIQDAFYPGTTPIYSVVSPEFQMMQSIAWDAPEPSALALFMGAIGSLGYFRRRRARSV